MMFYIYLLESPFDTNFITSGVGNVSFVPINISVSADNKTFTIDYSDCAILPGNCTYVVMMYPDRTYDSLGGSGMTNNSGPYAYYFRIKMPDPAPALDTAPTITAHNTEVGKFTITAPGSATHYVVYDDNTNRDVDIGDVIANAIPVSTAVGSGKVGGSIGFYKLDTDGGVLQYTGMALNNDNLKRPAASTTTINHNAEIENFSNSGNVEIYLLREEDNNPLDLGNGSFDKNSAVAQITGNGAVSAVTVGGYFRLLTLHVESGTFTVTTDKYPVSLVPATVAWNNLPDNEYTMGYDIGNTNFNSNQGNIQFVLDNYGGDTKVRFLYDPEYGDPDFPTKYYENTHYVVTDKPDWINLYITRMSDTRVDFYIESNGSELITNETFKIKLKSAIFESADSNFIQGLEPTDADLPELTIKFVGKQYASTTVTSVKINDDPDVDYEPSTETYFDRTNIKVEFTLSQPIYKDDQQTPFTASDLSVQHYGGMFSFDAGAQPDAIITVGTDNKTFTVDFSNCNLPATLSDAKHGFYMAVDEGVYDGAGNPHHVGFLSAVYFKINPKAVGSAVLTDGSLTTDTNMAHSTLSLTLNVTEPTDITDLTGYNVYWGKLENGVYVKAEDTAIATIPVSAAGAKVGIPITDKKIPQQGQPDDTIAYLATHLLVYAYTDDMILNYGTPQSVDIESPTPLAVSLAGSDINMIPDGPYKVGDSGGGTSASTDIGVIYLPNWRNDALSVTTRGADFERKRVYYFDEDGDIVKSALNYDHVYGYLEDTAVKTDPPAAGNTFDITNGRICNVHIYAMQTDNSDTHVSLNNRDFDGEITAKGRALVETNGQPTTVAMILKGTPTNNNALVIESGRVDITQFSTSGTITVTGTAEVTAASGRAIIVKAGINDTVTIIGTTNVDYQSGIIGQTGSVPDGTYTIASEKSDTPDTVYYTDGKLYIGKSTNILHLYAISGYFNDWMKVINSADNQITVSGGKITAVNLAANPSAHLPNDTMTVTLASGIHCDTYYGQSENTNAQLRLTADGGSATFSFAKADEVTATLTVTSGNVTADAYGTVYGAYPIVFSTSGNIALNNFNPFSNNSTIVFDSGCGSISKGNTIFIDADGNDYNPQPGDTFKGSWDTVLLKNVWKLNAASPASLPFDVLGAMLPITTVSGSVVGITNPTEPDEAAGSTEDKTTTHDTVKVDLVANLTKEDEEEIISE